MCVRLQALPRAGRISKLTTSSIAGSHTVGLCNNTIYQHFALEER